jgi:GT2 family glycosyltransferase
MLVVGRRVIVVVLNWNRRADTLACLASLLEQTYRDLSIVVVDNGSTDGSVAGIRATYPMVTVIENGTNLGYSEGNNVGIRYALERDAEYVMVLNNDTLADPAMLENLFLAAECDQKIAAVGPKILYFAHPQRIWSAGAVINYTETVSRSRGYGQPDRGQLDRREDVDMVSGCAMLLRREALIEIGPFDPVYSPAYFEDADWCLRARQHGYRVRYVPEAKLWHKVSLSSGGEYNPKERYLLGLNSVTFMKRYANWLQWIKFLIFAVGSLPAVYIVRSCQGRGYAVVAKAAGIMDGLRGVRRDSFLS